MRLVQIVPQLPPAIGGVSAFAATLARALEQAGGVSSRFLVAAGSWQASYGLAGEAIGERSAENLGRRLIAGGADTLLVHYVNYAYERRGCPFWLVRAVSGWRAATPARRLVTFFHEVYATGPPWRSSFWLWPVQRSLAERLLQASDGAATSLALYGRWLARWAPGRQPVVAPVFSTVGEPPAVPAPADRRPRALAVFGGSGLRRRAYHELRPALEAACRGLGIAEIVDLGPPVNDLPAEVAGLPVRTLGPRPEQEVSAILLGCYAGFLAYPPPFLAKSTVFAAYCAHGLVPVCAWPRPRRGLSAAGERPPFWAPGEQPPPADPFELATQARAWYAGHDLERQTAALGALLSISVPVAPAAWRRRPAATAGPRGRENP